MTVDDFDDEVDDDDTFDDDDDDDLVVLVVEDVDDELVLPDLDVDDDDVSASGAADDDDFFVLFSITMFTTVGTLFMEALTLKILVRHTQTHADDSGDDRRTTELQWRWISEEWGWSCSR